MKPYRSSSGLLDNKKSEEDEPIKVVEQRIVADPPPENKSPEESVVQDYENETNMKILQY